MDDKSNKRQQKQQRDVPFDFYDIILLDAGAVHWEMAERAGHTCCLLLPLLESALARGTFDLITGHSSCLWVISLHPQSTV